MITITINTDNSAFEDGDELPRILNELALRIQDGALIERDELKIRDINGATVGTVRAS